MSIKNDKYKFPSKDDFNSFYHYKSHFERKIESLEQKNPIKKEEVKLRSRTAKNKKISNDNFSLRHNLLCLSICAKKCNIEDHKCRRIPTPIEGLNCDKIDDYLFASQRLTNKVINQFDLINKLKELNVGLIVNCEEKGEHPFCGDPYYDGLDESCFAYSTSILEKNGINVLLCGWNDLGVPDSYNHLVKIVKKMYYYINVLNKKIIVHCHAGFGRTAIVLACYYIFTKKVNAEKARKLIRKGGRSRCLGSHIQFKYCREFAKYMETNRENFFEKNKKDITIFKINEKMLDVGNYKFVYFGEDNYIKYIPVFLLYIFDRIIQIKNKDKLSEKNIYDNILNENAYKEDEEKINNIIGEINKSNWEEVNKCEDLKLLNNILFKWLNHSIKYVINPKDISNLSEQSDSSNYNTLKESAKAIIDCIGIFFDLIRDEKNMGNNEFVGNYLKKFVPTLLGYSYEDCKNSEEKSNNVKKLNNLILHKTKNK